MAGPAAIDTDPLQTKDFVKFLSLVAILYLGADSAMQPRHGTGSSSYHRVPHNIHCISSGIVFTTGYGKYSSCGIMGWSC